MQGLAIYQPFCSPCRYRKISQIAVLAHPHFLNAWKSLKKFASLLDFYNEYSVPIAAFGYPKKGLTMLNLQYTEVVVAFLQSIHLEIILKEIHERSSKEFFIYILNLKESFILFICPFHTLFLQIT